MTDEQLDLVVTYRKRARRYDLTANLFYLVGFREWSYRKQAVKELYLQPGDTVIELGCGTGINFSLLEQAVGPEGRIIGVDLTDAMLDQARRRVDRHGWINVDLVRRDATNYYYQDEVAGILTSFSIMAMPDYDSIIQRSAESLPPGKRLVTLELGQPGWAPQWLRRFAIRLLSPFGVTAENAAYCPWESMQKHFPQVKRRMLYFNIASIATGIAGTREN